MGDMHVAKTKQSQQKQLVTLSKRGLLVLTNTQAVEDYTDIKVP